MQPCNTQPAPFGAWPWLGGACNYLGVGPSSHVHGHFAALGGRKSQCCRAPCSRPFRYELGRQPAMTKLSSNVAVRKVRVRGGNTKFRALRLDAGNFSWGTEVRKQPAPHACACCGLPGMLGVGANACICQRNYMCRLSPARLVFWMCATTPPTTSL